MRAALMILAFLTCVAGCHQNSSEDRNPKNGEGSQPIADNQPYDDQTAQDELGPGHQEIHLDGNEKKNTQTDALETSTSREQRYSNSKPPAQERAEPLTVHQYGQIFNAKEFVNQLALGEKIYVSFGGDSSIISDLAPSELQIKCREKLEKAGWKQVAHQSIELRAGSKREEFHFEKDGHAVAVTTSGPDESGTSLSVKLLGNIDMRKLPKAESFLIDENSGFAYVGYTTEEEIDAAMRFCRDRMGEDGWKEFTCISEPSCLPHPQSPNQVVAFCQSGFTCYITVGRYPGFKDGKTVVSYVATGILPVDLLIADDADDLKLDVLLGKASYKSNQKPTDIRKEIASHFRQLEFPLIEGSGTKSFIDIYDSGEGEQILTDITPLKDGVTSVQLIRQFDDPNSAR